MLTAAISTITDKLIAEVKAWQARPLENLYPFVWLDAIHYKIRDKGRYQNQAIYTVLALSMEGKKEIPGPYLSESVGANFGPQLFTDLQNRGVEDILIASVDGLTGFPEAVAGWRWLIAAASRQSARYHRRASPESNSRFRISQSYGRLNGLTRLSRSLLVVASLCVEMALPLFFERLADDLRFELLFGVRFLQPSIFLIKFLQPLHVRHIHAAVLGSPFKKLAVLMPYFRHNSGTGTPASASLSI